MMQYYEKLVAPIINKQKISTNLKEIVNSMIVRMLGTKTNEVYGALNFGLDIEKNILFSVDIFSVEDFLPVIQNYIKEKIPYLNDITLNVFPVRYNDFGETEVDYNNYTNIIITATWKIEDIEDTLLENYNVENSY